MTALITKIGRKYYYGHINLTKAINQIINEEKLKVREAIEKTKKQKFIMTKEAVYFIEKELGLKGEG
jgi:hypothetical protein